MAGKLIPSKDTMRFISKNKPLTKEQTIHWVEQYNKGSSKAADVIISGVSKMLASQIYKNESKFVKTLPGITFDELFNQMVLAILKGIKSYNPQKAALTTWAYYEIMPITKNPYQVMGSKFNATHNPASLDRTVGEDDDMTIGGLIPDKDGSPQDLYFAKSNKNKVMKAIKKLDKEQQQIVLNLFKYVTPRKDWQTKTGNVNATSIAKAKGISPDRMWRKLDKIYAKLRSELRESKLRQIQKVKKIERLIEKLSREI